MDRRRLARRNVRESFARAVTRSRSAATSRWDLDLEDLLPVLGSCGTVTSHSRCAVAARFELAGCDTGSNAVASRPHAPGYCGRSARCRANLPMTYGRGASSGKASSGPARTAERWTRAGDRAARPGRRRRRGVIARTRDHSVVLRNAADHHCGWLVHRPPPCLLDIARCELSVLGPGPSMLDSAPKILGSTLDTRFDLLTYHGSRSVPHARACGVHGHLRSIEKIH